MFIGFPQIHLLVVLNTPLQYFDDLDLFANTEHHDPPIYPCCPCRACCRLRPPNVRGSATKELPTWTSNVTDLGKHPSSTTIPHHPRPRVLTWRLDAYS